MKLTVVIVNYNVKYFLEQALYSVRRASQKLEVEVYVVDNTSVDGSNEMVREKFPEVKLIANKENVGFSVANNQAIRESKGEYVLLLNPDTVVQEDTFDNVVSFMDHHPNAGGLGIKMLDGKGNFLPESKRGLPTPAVAFYKIFGLSSLFPKSKTFGKYHLGYLDKDEIHEVEILAGAFMLLRKKTLDEIGLLDETFFMYGEDIDLSYRIIKGGYKNYYYPHSPIIHYKGESTKKGSINYVFVFYNAMVIFAKKHFSQSGAKAFSFLIHIAIYLRAFLALVNRFIKRITFPILDAAILFGGLYFLKIYWENNHKFVPEPYPNEILTFAFPSYITLWLIGVWFSGGYDKKQNISRLFRGLGLGSLLIFILYGMQPEQLRFSRALIVLGTFWAFLSLSTFRLILGFLKTKSLTFGQKKSHSVVIVGNEIEGNRVSKLLKDVNPEIEIIGFVNPLNNTEKGFLGTISQLKEINKVYKVNEIIFCNKDISSQEIIQQMGDIHDKNVEYKIVPEDSQFIIGSNSVDNPGYLYTIRLNYNLNDNLNRRSKRLLDILLSLIFLFLSPLLIFIQRKPIGLIPNILKIFIGLKTWVGYAPSPETKQLPDLKKGILSPLDLEGTLTDDETRNRLNLLYAKNYHIENDLNFIFNGIRKLGN
jgi:GT2 family glycosyltransferase